MGPPCPMANSLTVVPRQCKVCVLMKGEGGWLMM